MATVQDIEIRDSAARTAAAVEELQDIPGEKMVLNMGPSHPATHGVLRIVLELDGEVITKADPDVGYLHRGDEKIAENMTYTQFIPYTDRLDYLAPLANNVAYALAVEKLLGIHDKLPPRCQYIRVMCAELARISAHLLGLGAFAMDTGAVTVATSGDPCREDCLDAQARQCFECVVGLGQVPVVGEGFSGGGHCKGSLNRWQGWSRCCLDEVCALRADSAADDRGGTVGHRARRLDEKLGLGLERLVCSSFHVLSLFSLPPVPKGTGVGDNRVRITLIIG